ncbi:hypothetical protein [Gilliamella sp. wkB178]|uniref:hypothetical protein n=1 Tax=Gilliamella sp. wkB178 TaxID=3120259 RepID=UPI00080E6876|nr:hypothetical protein [Gilliamella apicola]
MENNLVVSAQGFSDEKSTNITINPTAILIKELIKRNQLNISKLKRVLITCDFESMLTENCYMFEFANNVIFTAQSTIGNTEINVSNG